MDDQDEIIDELLRRERTRAKRPIDFVDAMRLIDEAWNEWAEKDHNKKWVKRLEGTPIRNDLSCHIARKFINPNTSNQEGTKE